MKDYGTLPFASPAKVGRAFTLVEMLLSMAVATVLLGGIASALVIAGRALPGRETPLTNAVEGYHAAEWMAGELHTAQSFTVMTPTQVTFTVPDRNNDGAPESISYTWSGAGSASLMRQYNANPAVALAENVNEFDLAYDLQEELSTQPAEPNESEETLLISYDSTSSLDTYVVDSGHWIGQFFKPTLPPDATSWKITRVKFRAKVEGGNSGVTNVQLRPSNAGNVPTITVLDEVQLPESTLTSSYTWREAHFSAASGISPAQGICLVFKWVADTDSCALQYRKGNVTTFNSNLVDTSSGESGWAARTSDSLLYYVYGTITASSPPQTLKLYRLTGVEIKLRLGSDPSARVQTAVQVLNRPEVTGT